VQRPKIVIIRRRSVRIPPLMAHWRSGRQAGRNLYTRARSQSDRRKRLFYRCDWPNISAGGGSARGVGIRWFVSV